MRSRPNLLLIAAMVLFFSAAARAQPLSSSLTGSATIGETEKGQITTWVQKQVQALTGADLAARKAARDNLVDKATLPPGVGSPAFNAAYSQIVTKEIAPALTDKDAMVRLNAMLVVGNLPAPSIDQVIAALPDKNPGVRYAAGLAIKTMVAHAANAGGLAPADQKKLLKALATAAATEEDHHVAAALLTAMANLTIPEAIPTLMDTIEKRLPMHVVPPGPTMETVPLAPERLALSIADAQIVGAYTDLEGGESRRTPAQIPKPIQDNLNGLMKISSKLMDVASNRGGIAGLPAAAENDAALMVKDASGWIANGVATLYPAKADNARKIKNNVDALTSAPPQGQSRNWTNIRGEYLNCKTLLTDTPINYPAADVIAPQPATHP